MYMAPEVLGGTPPDARARHLGAGRGVVRDGVRGVSVSRKDHVSDWVARYLREAPQPLPMHVPPGLRAIILRCLAKQPEQRYQRASEVRAALEALHSNGGAVAAAAGPHRSGAGGAEEYKRYWWMSGGLLAAIAAVIYFVPGAKPSWRRHSGREIAATAFDGEKYCGAGDFSGREDVRVRGEGRELRRCVCGRVAGGDRVKLTKDVSRKGEPAFSPDGEKIAFARSAGSGQANEVCTIATFGGEIVPVAQGGSMPTWSPEGTRLTFVTRKPGEPEALAIASLDGSGTANNIGGRCGVSVFGRPRGRQTGNGLRWRAAVEETAGRYGWCR